MKLIGSIVLIGLSFLFTGITNAQERQKKFQFEFGYGVSLSGDFEKNDAYKSQGLQFGTPLIGKNIEAAVKYILPNRRFIGLGITVQSYVNTLNGVDRFNFGGVLGYRNFRLEEELQYYELQYGKFFDNGLDLTLSLFWINYYIPLVDSIPFSEGVELWNFDSLPDDFGLAFGLGYRLYENNSINISLRVKTAVTLSGLEAITLTPLMRFNF